MIGREPSVEDLHAYCDGELRGLARWRVRRWLARSGEARSELEILARGAEWAREVDREAASGPDLWQAIAARLPAIDVARVEGDGASSGAWLRGLGWSAAAAAGAAALAFFLLSPQTGGTQAVRWLDTGGRPVLVLEGEATIIWLLDAPSSDVSREVSRDLV